MSETRRDQSSAGDQDATESLRDVLRSLLGTAPAPELELSDTELLAEIREATESTREQDSS